MLNIKLIFRYLRTNKSITIINLVGLVIAFSIIIPISLFILHESSYDKWMADSDRIGRIVMEGSIGADQRIAGAMTSARMPIDLKAGIPEIEEFVRIDPWFSKREVKVNEKSFYEDKIIFADSTFFQVFGIPLVLGDAKKALTTKNSVVITESTAKKYFGDSNPIGQKMNLGRIEDSHFTVTGVMKDLGSPTHLPEFPMIISWVTFRSGLDDTPWIHNIDWITYVRLKEGYVLADVNEKMNAMMQENAGEVLNQIGGVLNIYFQPVKDCYLGSSHFNYITFKVGSRANVIQFAVIGLFILIIAIFNFINLTTARSMNRGRQVGISKVLGATRGLLVRSYLKESVFISFISALIAIGLTFLFINQFSRLFDSELTFNPRENIYVVLLVLSASILIGVIAGIYPALLITSYNPIKILRGQLKTGKQGRRIRGGLVVLQYTVSIALILSTLVISNQLNYLRKKDLGFDQSQVISVRIPTQEMMQQHNVLRNEITQLPGVSGVAGADQMPNHTVNNNVYHIPGRSVDDQILCAGQRIDADYMNVIGWKLLDGRNFDKSIVTDTVDAIILNETARSMFGITDLEGAYINEIVDLYPPKFKALRVIGVVKDYHFADLYETVRPMVIRAYKGNPYYLFIKLAPGNFSESINSIERIWQSYDPNLKFDYKFLDELFAKAYEKEKTVSRLFNFFTMLAIIIASMGLWALATYNAEQRRREISVRKVVGASVLNLVKLMVWPFVKLILVAIVLAWPIAEFVTGKWLSGFAYTAESAWWLYPAAGGVALLIAVLTVFLQAWKTANLNPAVVLKSE